MICFLFIVRIFEFFIDFRKDRVYYNDIEKFNYYYFIVFSY